MCSIKLDSSLIGCYSECVTYCYGWPISLLVLKRSRNEGWLMVCYCFFFIPTGHCTNAMRFCGMRRSGSNSSSTFFPWTPWTSTASPILSSTHVSRSENSPYLIQKDHCCHASYQWFSCLTFYSINWGISQSIIPKTYVNANQSISVDIWVIVWLFFQWCPTEWSSFRAASTPRVCPPRFGFASAGRWPILGALPPPKPIYKLFSK